MIADFEVTEKMLRYFITQGPRGTQLGEAAGRDLGARSASPAVERRAVVHSAERAGARRVFLIDEPMAAGIGIDLPVTEATRLADRRHRRRHDRDRGRWPWPASVVATSLRVAGDEFDEAIVSHMRRHHNLMIGEQTAERIKLTIGSAWPMEQELSMDVKGRDTVTGLPRARDRHLDRDPRGAVRAPCARSARPSRRRARGGPARDLGRPGATPACTIVGGGALLHGIARRRLGLPRRPGAHRRDDPLTAVARGTGVFLDKLDVFSKVLSSDDEGERPGNEGRQSPTSFSGREDRSRRAILARLLHRERRAPAGSSSFAFRPTTVRGRRGATDREPGWSPALPDEVWRPRTELN